MSLVRKYMKGWTFRTPTPEFEPESEYRVVITGYDEAEGTAVARVGDSVLYVDGTEPAHVDTVARIRVTEFDRNDHVGRADLLEVVDTTTY